MGKEEEKKSFVVKDRRAFSESGESRAAEEPAAKTTAETAAAKAEPPPEQAGTDETFMTEVNFMNFILSLSSTTLFHLGEFQDPAQPVNKNLPAAKQIIDTLVMLRNKTQGNLDEGEKNMLEGVLYELQMRYVKELR